MGLTFLIILTIAEITLITLPFTKYSEKAAWLKNRTLVTAVETIILLAVVLLPVTHMKWRFALALVILIVRLLFELIRFSVRRKKASGLKHKAAAVASGVLSVVFVALSLAPAFIFTNYNGLENTGEHNVVTASAILVDKNRTDTFENDGSFREVPIHFFYPQDDGSYPLVIFSHGAFGYYQSNFSTYTELASHGYVVAALDHPHHAFFTSDTSGNTVIVDNGFINDVMKISGDDVSEEEIFSITQDWMKLRTDDENFVLDTVKQAAANRSLGDEWNTRQENDILTVLSRTDVDKIGLMGHSMGGATSVAIGRERDDIDAVVVLDGTMLSERISVKDGKYQYIDESYPVPVIDFTKEIDYNNRELYSEENGYAYVNSYVVENAKDGKTVICSGVKHMDFTDLPLISPFLASMLDGGESEVNNEEFITMINGMVLNWFDYYLKGEGALNIPERC